MDQHGMLVKWSQSGSDETAATILFVVMCPRRKGDLKALPGLMNCSGLEVTIVPFCSPFIGHNMSCGSTQSPGVQEVQPYETGESQRCLLNGIYHSLSTYRVPGIVLSVFLIEPFISSTIHGSRAFHLQLILE